MVPATSLLWALEKYRVYDYDYIKKNDRSTLKRRFCRAPRGTSWTMRLAESFFIYRHATYNSQLQAMNKIISLFEYGTFRLNLYCIVYRHLYSASHGVNQTEALAVHFSSRKKVRLKARESRGKGSRENKRAKMRRVIPE